MTDTPCERTLREMQRAHSLLSEFERLGVGPWVCRWSDDGRGLRLHETTKREAGAHKWTTNSSPQDAIAAFLEEQKIGSRVLTDTELLDGLERRGNGPWICRRLHRVSKEIQIHQAREGEEWTLTIDPAGHLITSKPASTIRAAISMFLEAEKSRPA